MDIVKALILICAVELSPADCNSDTAQAVISGPETTSGGLCGLQGQAFLAQTALGQEISTDEYVKVVCRRTGKALAQAESPAQVDAPVTQARIPE